MISKARIVKRQKNENLDNEVNYGVFSIGKGSRDKKLGRSH
jgi:hypothetical protein